jgi:hypothetical protein
MDHKEMQRALGRRWEALVHGAKSHTPPNLRRFLAAVWADVGARMSGVFSVPFVTIGTFFPTFMGGQQGLWFSLALAAMLFAAYRVWSTVSAERDSLVAELERLRSPAPRTLDFDYAPDVFYMFNYMTVADNHMTDELLVRVKNYSSVETIDDVRVTLRHWSMQRGATPSMGMRPVGRELAPHPSPGTAGVSINPRNGKGFRLVAERSALSSMGAKADDRRTIVIAPSVVDEVVEVPSERPCVFRFALWVEGRHQSPAEAVYELSFVDRSVISFGLRQEHPDEPQRSP